MLYLLQPRANVTAAPRASRKEAYELALLGVVTVGLICSFFYINCVLLFTLRSKQLFCETSRYILLYNLLFADTLQQIPNLLLYILGLLVVRIPYYACGVLVVISLITDSISPLTLAVMSLERYVAVCHPLKHAIIVTVRNTGAAIAVVWATSFIQTLIQVLMLVYVVTKNPFNMQMNYFCSKQSLLFAPIFHSFEIVYPSMFFLSVGLAIIASYIGVVLVATSASKDRESARRALWTILLHLVQLGLVLLSTFTPTLLIAFTRIWGRVRVSRMANVCYIFLNVIPRGMSALIYGLRDRSIRPALVHNLCSWWRRCALLFKCR